MRCDYHIHTARCKHAIGTMEAYVQQAIKLGLDEIAFTDHIPLPDGFDLAHRMAEEEFESYLQEIDRLRADYPQIRILAGIEADFYDGFEPWLESFLYKAPLDVVIGSVHFIRDWPKNNWAFSYHFPDKTLRQIYSEYLAAVKRAVASGLFDIIGHIDLVKSPDHGLLAENEAELSDILAMAATRRMAVELNSSGLRKEVEEPYPAYNILPLIATSGLPVTLGSDAHEPHQVGWQFDVLLKEIGNYPALHQARFEQRNLNISEWSDK